ncbi:16987_t:CDS:2 [Rhizophagus irregularis]|nr:16987_t:CDS:2 [Rhizophagus irregularis]
MERNITKARGKSASTRKTDEIIEDNEERDVNANDLRGEILRNTWDREIHNKVIIYLDRKINELKGDMIEEINNNYERDQKTNELVRFIINTGSPTGDYVKPVFLRSHDVETRANEHRKCATGSVLLPVSALMNPEGENQDDDQTDASEAKTNTLTSAKISVQTEFRLSELNPNEPFLIKNKFDIL